MMQLTSRTLLAVGGWLAFGGALGYQGLQLKRFPENLSPEAQFSELHRALQSAMDDLTMTNLREMTTVDPNGKKQTIKVSPTFGISRSVPIAMRHNGVIRDSGEVFVQNVPEFYGLSSKGEPLDGKNLTLHSDLGFHARGAKPEFKDAVLNFAKKAIRPLKSKEVYRGLISGYTAQARAIKLSKPECLSCHPGMKKGDNAAIIVYLNRTPGKR